MLNKLKSKLFHTEIGMSAVYHLRNARPWLDILTAQKTIDYVTMEHPVGKSKSYCL